MPYDALPGRPATPAAALAARCSRSCAGVGVAAALTLRGRAREPKPPAAAAPATAPPSDAGPRRWPAAARRRRRSRCGWTTRATRSACASSTRRAPGCCSTSTPAGCCGARDPTRVLPIASLTKMMTALRGRRPRAAGREGADHQGGAALPGLGRRPAPARASGSASTTMLYGLLLPSGNDAAIALAQRAAGTRAALRRADERERARRWASSARTSRRPSGFVDRGNHSCARRPRGDRPRGAARAAAGPDRAPPPGRAAVPDQGRQALPLQPQPAAAAGLPRASTGVKTGYTDAAGRCLVATARRGPLRLGVVLLHSPDPGTQATQAARPRLPCSR